MDILHKLKNERNILIIMSLVVVGAILRLYQLNKGFWGDELFSIHLHDDLYAFLFTPGGDSFRPFFFLIMYLWKFIATTPFEFRIVPFLFGVATIPYFFRLGQLLFKKSEAIISTFLLVVSPFHISFSQELRMYSAEMFFVTASLYYYASFLENPKVITLWVSSLFLFLGIITHIHVLLIVPMYVIYPLWRFREYKHLVRSILLSLGVISIFSLPFLYQAFLTKGNLLSASTIVDIPSSIPKVIAAFSLGYTGFRLGELNIARAIGIHEITSNLFIICASIIGFGFSLFFALLSLRERKKEMEYVFLWFVVPILVGFLLAIITNNPTIKEKYLIYASGGYYFLIGKGITSAVKRYRALAAIMVIALVGTLGFSLYNYYFDKQNYGREENFEALTEYLRVNAHSGDNVVFYTKGIPKYNPVDYYWSAFQTNPVYLLLDTLTVYNQTNVEKLLGKTLAQRERVWLVYSDTWRKYYDVGNFVIAYLDEHYSLKKEVEFNPRLRLIFYSKRNGVPLEE
jgi:mannosyltransferase